MNNKRTVYIAVVTILIITIAVVILKTRNNTNVLDTTHGISLSDFGLQGEDLAYLNQNKDKNQHYTDPKHRFEFYYPNNYTLGSFGTDAAEGETLLIQDKEKKSQGFQIYITHFDEPGKNLTADRVHTEIPDWDIQNTKEISLQGQVIGLTFTHIDQGKEVKETWFASAGWMYQITSYVEDTELLSEVLSTWKFK